MIKRTTILLFSIIIAPLVVALTLLASIPIESLISKLMWKMNWAPYGFWTSIETLLTVGVILQVSLYAFIAWSLFRLHKQYRSGVVSARVFTYISASAGFSLFLSIVILLVWSK